MKTIFPIGTRGSPLALAQARETQNRLAQAMGLQAVDLQVMDLQVMDLGEQTREHVLPLRIITTTGDTILDRALSESGGKGLFTKEIDAAQLNGEIAIAVHSAKDLPTHLPEGLIIAGYWPREDARDALISLDNIPFLSLKSGATIGTASLRRQAMLLRQRPDLKIELLRGNVGTRIQKIKSGALSATLLAIAGLNRLGLHNVISEKLETNHFLPAVGQGAIALVIREHDIATRELLSPLLCAQTQYALAAERAFLTTLDGSCRTPLAGHAVIIKDEIHFKGMVFSTDGAQAFEIEQRGSIEDAQSIGHDAGLAIKSRAKPFLDWL